MKTCRECQVSKDESEFYKSKVGKLSSYCKPCHIERSRKWWKADPKRKYEINQSWRLLHKERLKLANKAHQLVFKAVKSGRLVRATVCEKCSSTYKIEASHRDYSKPLEVTWLCVKCHRVYDMSEPKTSNLEQK